MIPFPVQLDPGDDDLVFVGDSRHAEFYRQRPSAKVTTNQPADAVLLLP
jgi:hypothetical protein